MLFLKRFITSVVLFVILFAMVWIGTLVVGAVVVTTQRLIQMHEQHGGMPLGPGESREAGREVGREFGRKFGGAVALFAFVVAAIAAPAMSFGGVFVWCRRKKEDS